MARYWLLCLRLAALLAVAASAALLLHYLAPAELGFCGPQSGCETVRKSAIAAFGFVGLLPSIGLSGYVGIFWLTFIPSLRRWLMPAALLGAGVGVALFLQQVLILHAFCWLCVSVDGMALLAGVCSVLLHRSLDPSWSRQWDALKGGAWFALLALSINAPSVWPKVRASDALPSAIQELQRPGVLTVVEFVDFECPHCRYLHPIVSAAVALQQQPSRVLRFHVPLSFHIFADGAARAAICGAQFGKEEPMANLLFEQDLEADVWFAHAATLGIPAEAFRACIGAESTGATLAKHRELFDSLRMPSLPVTFIGGETLKGSAGPDLVTQLFDKAQRPGLARLSPSGFGALVMLVAAAIVLLGRRRSLALA